jgi:hypothetical protein
VRRAIRESALIYDTPNEERKLQKEGVRGGIATVSCEIIALAKGVKHQVSGTGKTGIRKTIPEKS